MSKVWQRLKKMFLNLNLVLCSYQVFISSSVYSALGMSCPLKMQNIEIKFIFYCVVSS